MEKKLSCFANITRLKILLCLAKSEKNVSDLIKNCHLSQSAVSQHLERLRTAELVQTRKDGKEVYYSLTDKKSAELSKQLLSFIGDESI